MVDEHGHEIVTLRDWFAGQALCGLWCGAAGHEFDADDLAAVAYQQADAMLAARNKEASNE